MTPEQLRKRLLKRFKGDPVALSDRAWDESSLIPTLLNFIAAHPSLSQRLFNMHGSVKPLGTRLGKGEVLVWFIYPEVTLGGSSTSTDVWVGGEPKVEIKCARREGERYGNFLLGMDEVSASLKFFYKLLRTFEELDKLGLYPLPQRFAHITTTQLNNLKRLAYDEYLQAEQEYFIDLINSPVGGKKYLIFDGDTNLPIYFDKLKPELLSIERISGGLTRISLRPHEEQS